MKLFRDEWGLWPAACYHNPMQATRGLRFAVIVSLVLGACVPIARGPYTAADLARDGQREPSAALLRYLAQPQADPAVCAMPFVKKIELDGVDDLVSAGADNALRPDVFYDCVLQAFDQWDGLHQRRAVSALGDAYLSALRDKNSKPPLRAALRRLMLQAPAARVHAAALRDIPSKLRDDLADHDFDRTTQPLAREWLVALELSSDRYQGKLLTPQTILSLDEVTLQLAAARLNNEELRAHARTELVRRRAERSPYSSVHDAVDQAVQQVLTVGHNPIDLTQHPVAGMTLDERLRQVLVWQDTERGTALLSAAVGKARVGYVSLRDLLSFTAKNVEQPIKMCGPAEELDPSPCVPAEELHIEAADSRMDRDGVLHLPDALPLDRVLNLAANRGYTLRIQASKAALQRELRVDIEPPAALSWVGGSNGARGPDLHVKVYERGGFALFKVDVHDGAARESRSALVDIAAPAEFSIASRGGKGSTGSTGSSGFDGSDGRKGSDASCGGGGSAGDGSSGGNGSNGGSGGTGGPGGRGGDIDVEVSCSSNACSALMALLPKIVRSVGGPGGDGGAGGPGGRRGRGGRGGSGTTCWVRDSSGSEHMQSVSGGHDGFDGMDGSKGFSGMSGVAGTAGHVRIVRSSSE